MWGRGETVALHPQTAIVKQEPFATHSGKMLQTIEFCQKKIRFPPFSGVDHPVFPYFAIKKTFKKTAAFGCPSYEQPLLRIQLSSSSNT